MKNKIIMAIMSPAIVVLAVMNVSMRNELAVLKSALEEKACGLAVTEAELKPDNGEIITAVEEEAIPVQAGSAAEAEAPEEKPARRVIRSLAKMRENPAMNKMMEASQRGALDVMYEALLADLDLNAEEREYLMNLLVVRQMHIVDASMKMLGGGLTEEEQRALSANIKEGKKEIDNEIELFLNDEDDVAEWKFYEKTLQERVMLTQVDKQLDESGASMSDETYYALLKAIHEEKENHDWSSDLGDNDNMDLSPQRFSSGNISNFEDDLRGLNEKVIARAGAILTSGQLAVLSDNLQNQVEMQIAQLQMASQMFGGD